MERLLVIAGGSINRFCPAWEREGYLITALLVASSDTMRERPHYCSSGREVLTVHQAFSNTHTSEPWAQRGKKYLITPYSQMGKIQTSQVTSTDSVRKGPSLSPGISEIPASSWASVTTLVGGQGGVLGHLIIPGEDGHLGFSLSLCWRGWLHSFLLCLDGIEGLLSKSFLPC